MALAKTMKLLVVDQLSIDSKTGTKIQMNTTQDSQSPSGMRNMSSNEKQTMTSNTTSKAHFRIDWRQLTYFKKENRSRTCQLFSSSTPKHVPSPANNNNNNNKLEHQPDQLDESLYDFEYGSRCDGDNDDDVDERDFSSQRDAVSSRLSQNLESGRASRSSYQPAAAAPTGRHHRQAILNSLDGCFRSGQLSAILGPSGAGKSTFLSALFGNKQESSFGQTRVTWFSEPNSAINTKRSIRIASLPQQDHLLNHLTVYEALMFASKIKNPHQPRSPTNSFHRTNVRRVAKTLKLTECLQTRCGRLSGGQYKRVSIAQELLSEPDVIILDEPTSGLDALTCLTTIRTLKSIVTKHPISIILTIHQPDIDVFNLFDHIYVIAQGGLAIYEGPPDGVAPTLAQVGLTMPDTAYNPARFIVENAFVSAPDDSFEMGQDQVVAENKLESGLCDVADDGDNSASDHSDELDEDEDENQDETKPQQQLGVADFLRQSLSSIAAALKSPDQDLRGVPTSGCSPPPASRKSGGLKQRFRDSGRQPLLQIGIQTADGKLITRNQLNETATLTATTTTTTASSTIGASSRAATLNGCGAGGADDHWELRRKFQARLRVLGRLNEIQKRRYYKDGAESHSDQLAAESSFTYDESDLLSQQTVNLSIDTNRKRDGAQSLDSGHQLGQSNVSSPCSSAPSSTSSSWSIARDQLESADDAGGQPEETAGGGGGGQRAAPPAGITCELDELATSDKQQACRRSPSTTKCETMTTTTSTSNHQLPNGTLSASSGPGKKLRRQFDKRLSSKRIQTRDHTIWYHSFLLTHRTWLSIVRDPVFFGIQFAMHTTIPILLAVIFGSHQEEGCPKAGNFDLVEFAYAQDSAHFLQDSMQSLRKSIGNIGVVFFEMFVLSFAINCITALVFPLDMHVLLKEHRNGWYSMTSYFFGRTLADLPVPVVLHSMAMSILCYMTGQPLSWWRFLAVLAIVIVASLVAQSVGLTIGALLMRSSQSAVLAAAGIVAPFFALSGFIVRIHTLPLLAQWAAQGSYLYHLINGFIVMRYGFDRCPCSAEDFLKNEAHEIPQNLRTMASIWIGTYSNEFELDKANEWDQLRAERHQVNRTNLDPNIDIIDKLLAAFKMANSYGHKVDNCNDVQPYAMLDFNLRDSDIFHCISSLIIMLIVTRFITFSAIYYKIRSFS